MKLKTLCDSSPLPFVAALLTVVVDGLMESFLPEIVLFICKCLAKEAEGLSLSNQVFKSLYICICGPYIYVYADTLIYIYLFVYDFFSTWDSFELKSRRCSYIMVFM